MPGAYGKRKRESTPHDSESRKIFVAGAVHGQLTQHTRLSKSFKQDLASIAGVSASTVRDVVTTVRKSESFDDILGNLQDARHTNPGRPVKQDPHDFEEEVRAIPVEERHTYQDLASRLGMNPETVTSYMRRLGGRKRQGRIQPKLSKDQCIKRVEYCLRLLCMSKMSKEDLKTNRVQVLVQDDVVHIDESHVEIEQRKDTYICFPDENPPYRGRPSKNRIPKVMCLAAVAKPARGFDGKIKICFSVEQTRAKRNSKNRPKGTLLYQPVNVDKEQFVSMLCVHILPAIAERMTRRGRNGVVWVQMDNAKPHAKVADDPRVKQTIKELKRDIRLIYQPTQSPDLNVLDLALFHSFKKRALKLPSHNIEEVMRVMTDVYEKYPEENLERAFSSFQATMLRILEHGGSNKFDPPHWHAEQGVARGAQQSHIFEIEGMTVLRAQELVQDYYFSK
jgi:hypothetical protein